MNPNTPGQRILVVGASGQIGTQILNILPPGSAVPTSRRPQGPGWIALDLASSSTRKALMDELLRTLNVGTVYCVGAMTNVDACESSPDLAMRANCKGPAALAAAAAKQGIGFVYFSTEYVFSGQEGPYDEDAPASPISVYGRSKWLGELAVQDSHPTPLIIRTTVVYGPDLTGKNFLYGLRRALSGSQSFRAPNDQISTPTYNVDLAASVVALAQGDASGIFNVTGPDLVSRLEFAQRSAQSMGLDTSNLIGVSTSELHQAAPRPLRAGLLANKLYRYLPQQRMRGIEEAILHWIKDIGFNDQASPNP